jgi:FixJ family two-component response regulator
LGLYSARQAIESYGGNIEFTSEVGKGTILTIKLPRCEISLTHISSININNYQRIIILDDDPSFHEVWIKRLTGLESKIEHIYSVKEMFSKYRVLHPEILLLSDFELMDKDYDGIDMIIKLNHVKHSLLVTARNEEPEIQERCLKAGIKLLPKSLVNYVKVITTMSHFDLTSEISKNFEDAGERNEIFVQGGQGGVEFFPPVVLIDDDKLVHINWASYCKNKGVPFVGFKSIYEFIKDSDTFDKRIKIFVDSNLGDGTKGEIESQKIFNLGFRNIYLATGYQKSEINKPSWIIDVYLKGPEVIMDIFYNDKGEVFALYNLQNANAIAKIIDFRWVVIYEWNTYPDCVTLDSYGVPYKISSLEISCQTNGVLRSTSENKE